MVRPFGRNEQGLSFHSGANPPPAFPRLARVSCHYRENSVPGGRIRRRSSTGAKTSATLRYERSFQWEEPGAYKRLAASTVKAKARRPNMMFHASRSIAGLTAAGSGVSRDGAAPSGLHCDGLFNETRAGVQLLNPILRNGSPRTSALRHCAPPTDSGADGWQDMGHVRFFELKVPPRDGADLRDAPMRQADADGGALHDVSGKRGSPVAWRFRRPDDSEEGGAEKSG